MVIDIHAHCLPRPYLEALYRFHDGVSRATPAEEADDSEAQLKARFELMDQAGIDLQVISIGSRLPYSATEREAVNAACLANDLLASIAKKHPTRLRALAVTPLPHIGASLSELERVLDGLDMAGVMIATSVLGRSLADPLFEPILAELDRRAAVVELHPTGLGFGSQTEPFGLRWLVGAPFEDTLATLQLILSGATLRYPNIKLIIPHLGGFLPFVAARLDSQSGRRGSSDAPSELAKGLWYDTVSHGQPSALRCGCETFGADRFVLGTDYPYHRADDLTDAVDYIRRSGMPDAQVEAILGETARTLLGL